MLKSIDLSIYKNIDGKLLTIIEKSINSTNTTIVLLHSQFKILEDLGFKMIIADMSPFNYIFKNQLFNKSDFKEDFSFIRSQGNKETVIVFSKYCFSDWRSDNVKYMMTGKVYYKNKAYYNNKKPTIIIHSKILLTNNFTNVMIYHNNTDIDAYYQSTNKSYRVKLETNKNIFLNLVEYDSPNKINNIEINSYGKILNLNQLFEIFPRIKDINRINLIKFENVFSLEELKLLEIISI